MSFLQLLIIRRHIQIPAVEDVVAAILVGDDRERFVPAVPQGIGTAVADTRAAFLLALAAKDEMTQDSVTIISARPWTTASMGQPLWRTISFSWRSVASTDAVMAVQPKDA